MWVLFCRFSCVKKHLHLNYFHGRKWKVLITMVKLIFCLQFARDSFSPLFFGGVFCVFVLYIRCFDEILIFLLSDSDRIQNENDCDNNRGSLSVLVFVICNYSLFLSFFARLILPKLSLLFAFATLLLLLLVYNPKKERFSFLIILNIATMVDELWGIFGLNCNCQVEIGAGFLLSIGFVPDAIVLRMARHFADVMKTTATNIW